MLNVSNYKIKHKFLTKLSSSIFVISIMVSIHSCVYNTQNNKDILCLSDDCLTDSIVFNHKNNKSVVWLRPNETTFELLLGSKLYSYNDKFKTLDSIKQKFTDGADDVFKIGNEYFYDRRTSTRNLVKEYQDSLSFYPLPTTVYYYNKKNYSLQLYSNNSFVRLPNNEFIAPILYRSDSDASTTTDYLKNCNQNRLGHFNIINNQLKIKRLINFFPRADFFIGDKRFNNIQLTICQNSQNYFIALNSLDTIFEYAFNGKLVKLIPLPEELKYQYYYNETDIVNTQSRNLSEISGSRNFKLYYNFYENHLILITFEGLNPDKKYEIIPKFEEFDWLASVYDLNKEKWIKIIKFNKDHDIRNVMFQNRNILVKRAKSEQLIFDKYAY